MHVRCPACGQGRPQKALDLAGTHRLELIQLRGQGYGRGFSRESHEPDLAALSNLLDCLDRARAQVITEINRVTATQPASAPPHVAPSAPVAPQWAATAPGPTACPRCHQLQVWCQLGRWGCPRCGIW